MFILSIGVVYMDWENSKGNQKGREVLAQRDSITIYFYFPLLHGPYGHHWYAYLPMTILLKYIGQSLRSDVA